MKHQYDGMQTTIAPHWSTKQATIAGAYSANKDKLSCWSSDADESMARELVRTCVNFSTPGKIHGRISNFVEESPKIWFFVETCFYKYQ